MRGSAPSSRVGEAERLRQQQQHEDGPDGSSTCGDNNSSNVDGDLAVRNPLPGEGIRLKVHTVYLITMKPVYTYPRIEFK